MRNNNKGILRKISALLLAIGIVVSISGVYFIVVHSSIILWLTIAYTIAWPVVLIAHKKGCKPLDNLLKYQVFIIYFLYLLIGIGLGEEIKHNITCSHNITYPQILSGLITATAIVFTQLPQHLLNKEKISQIKNENIYSFYRITLGISLALSLILFLSALIRPLLIEYAIGLFFSSIIFSLAFAALVEALPSPE
ncbi:hypothetical protein [Saccharolobus islandicus]|uniref:hypothetical protein n=1 Tax=Saccharolobus islandicus TaxID=43080 RepID=UPI00037A8774|nr:hypothetical protein [Sulfolobus islandicus]